MQANAVDMPTTWEPAPSLVGDSAAATADDPTDCARAPGREVCDDDRAPPADAATIANLVARHYPMVYGTCLRITGDHHDAEDASQGVFLTLADKSGSLDDVDSLVGWLHGVARNVARHLRRAKETRRRHEQAAEFVPADPTASDDVVIERVQEALARVPDNYRIPLLLHYRDGHCCRAIAKRIGVREETVAMRLSRGRQMLRRHLVGTGPAAAAAGGAPHRRRSPRRAIVLACA